MAENNDNELPSIMSPSFWTGLDLWTSGEVCNSSSIFHNDSLHDLHTPDSNGKLKRLLSDDGSDDDVKKLKCEDPASDISWETLSPTLDFLNGFNFDSSTQMLPAVNESEPINATADQEVADALFGKSYNDKDVADNIEHNAASATVNDPSQELDSQGLDNVHFEQDFGRAPILSDNSFVQQDLYQRQEQQAPVDEELENIQRNLNLSLEGYPSLTHFNVTVARDTRRNHITHDIEHVFQANVEAYKGEMCLFVIDSTIYSENARHPGNRSTTLCSINYGNMGQIELVSTVMNIFDFNKAIGQKRIYIHCSSEVLAKQIIDKANQLGKLALANCDQIEIMVNDDKWGRNLDGHKLIYRANQLLGEVHWSDRSINHLPLYLQVSREMENAMGEFFGNGVTYDQICSNEFKTSNVRIVQWGKFRRRCKEQILTTKASFSTYIACLNQSCD